MRIISLFFFLLACTFSNATNKLVLCTSYDDEGNYVGNFNTWTIRKAGNYMFVLYQSSVPIQDTLFVNFEKTYSRRDTNYYPYDHYYLLPGASKLWAANKYIFTKPGNYRISVYYRDIESPLAVYTTSIEYSNEDYADRAFTDTWYFNDSRISFCDSVSNSNLIGKKEVFPAKPGGNKIVLHIELLSKKNLKTEHMIVKIFSKDTHELVSSRAYSLSNEWYWTFVPIYIQNPGKYDVEVYNEDDIFINQAQLEVK